MPQTFNEYAVAFYQAGLNGTLSVTTTGGGTGALASQVQGTAASGATAVGNPIQFGGVFTTTRPTLTNGQVGAIPLTARGALYTVIGDTALATASILANSTDAQSPNQNGLLGNSFLYGFNGATWDRLRADTNGLVTQPHALSGARWFYAAASGGISNTTTAVTIKAAAGAGVRNYITSVQLSADTLGAATEVVIRDGAGGTVLWRGKIGTAGISGIQSVSLAVPIMGTANTLLEVATLTASISGGVYFNCQGYTGA